MPLPAWLSSLGLAALIYHHGVCFGLPSRGMFWLAITGYVLTFHQVVTEMYFLEEGCIVQTVHRDEGDSVRLAW